MNKEQSRIVQDAAIKLYINSVHLATDITAIIWVLSGCTRLSAPASTRRLSQHGSSQHLEASRPTASPSPCPSSPCGYVQSRTAVQQGARHAVANHVTIAGRAKACCRPARFAITSSIPRFHSRGVRRYRWYVSKALMRMAHTSSIGMARRMAGS